MAASLFGCYSRCGGALDRLPNAIDPDRGNDAVNKVIELMAGAAVDKVVELTVREGDLYSAVRRV
jgi:hypothetical protein